MRPLALMLALLPLPAFADCGAGGQVFTCQIGKKVLEICNQGADLTYAFGPKGAPELTISEPMTTVNFTPWPGVGSNIWESVIFLNADIAYEVWTSQERSPEAEGVIDGGINVLNGEELVAELVCDPGTASQPLEIIFELKEMAGMCWEFNSQSWKTTCDNG